MKNNNIKTTRSFLALILTVLVFTSISCKNQVNSPIPHFEKQGAVTQLIVDGKPYLVLGGELHNSSSTSREYLKEFWPKLKASGMNTVLAAVEWSLVEPEKGKFNFTIIDNLLEDARANDLKLVLLWFGSWKNGQSHYNPDWQKSDFHLYPRVLAENGKSLEILSVFSKENLNADIRSFAAMMNHLKAVDSESGTVIMIQVENEVGILGSPRDHRDSANLAFSSPVPAELNRGWRRDQDVKDGYCLIISLNNDEFIIHGNNVIISFSPATEGPAIAAIARVDEGIYANGVWIPGRRLNGDDIALDIDLAKKALENKTGTGLKFSSRSEKLQRVKLYRYE